MTPPNPSRTDLLGSYRQGHSEAGNQLLRHYQPWLQLLARLQIQSRFQAKFDPADVVQQTLIEAVRDFPKFRGSTEGEFAAWLRQILAHVLAHEIRRYHGTQKRDLDREQSIDADLAASSLRLNDMLAASGTSPSQALVKQEQQLELARALERLPDDHREVILLRNLEGLSHDEIATRLGRKPGAVRMLWIRALTRLRQEMEQTPP